MPGHDADALVSSTLEPVAMYDSRGKLQPIDLELLSTADGFRAKRTSVPTWLPARASGAITMGDERLGRLRVSLGGRAVPAVLTGEAKKAFYANTAVDADTIIEAMPRGVEVSWTLRSPASPEVFPLIFDDAASDFQLSPDGGVSFSAKRLGSGQIGAPVAHDARGEAVAVRLVPRSDGVDVQVDHQSADVAYPIVVDPWVVIDGVPAIRDDDSLVEGVPRPVTNKWYGPDPFGFSTNNPTNMLYSSTPQGSGHVMKIAVRPTARGSSYANLMYDAPRASTIFRATLVNVAHRQPFRSELRVGLINAAGVWESQAVAWIGGSCPNPSGCWAGGSYLANSPGMETATVEVCATGSCGMGGSWDNKLLFQFLYTGLPGDSAPTNAPYAQTRGAYIYYSDYTNPSLELRNQQNMPGGVWGKNQPNPSFQAVVTDNEVGVSYQKAPYGNGFYYEEDSAFNVYVDQTKGLMRLFGSDDESGPGCTGSWLYPCPTSISHPLYSARSLELAEGKQTYRFVASDIVGHKSMITKVIRTDREGPEITISGRLGSFATTPDKLDNAPPRTLVKNSAFVIHAVDGQREHPNGTPTSPMDHRSGVRSISARVYGSTVDLNTGKHTINLNEVTQDLDAANSPAGPKQSNAEECDPAGAGKDPDVNNSCKLDYGGTFKAEDLAPGVYFLRIAAEDYAGNVTEEDHAVAVGVASLNTVVEGAASSRYVPVRVHRKRGGGTEATIQFRTAVNQPWCDVDSVVESGQPLPLAAEDAPRAPVSDVVQLDENGRSADYVLDLDALRKIKADKTCASSGERLPDGVVFIRALVVGTDPIHTRSSEDVLIKYDHGGLGSDDAIQDLGPGTVDMVTGNLSISATDVSIDAYKAGLTVTRTYNSRYSTKEGPLGPGWVFGVESDAADSPFVELFDYADPEIVEEFRYPAVEAMTSDGESLIFEETDTPNKYRTETGDESLELKAIRDPQNAGRTVGYRIHDHDTGTVIEFKRKASADEPGNYVASDIIQPGSSGEVTYAYAKEGTLGSVVKYAFAPDPGVNCRVQADFTASQQFDGLPRGCQALRFTYTDVSGGTRLTLVEMRAWDPDSGSMVTTAVAQYGYDAAGRLTEQWDPRISPALKTTYGLQGSGDPLITSVTPPGESAFEINYQSLVEDIGTGRVESTQRTPVGGATAKWALRYYVPTYGEGAPFNFSKSTVATWGQQHAPVMATAVFPPDQQPNGSPATNYDRASINYMDALGRTLNTRDPGDRVSTVEYDKWGMVTRTLSPENRARALALATPAERLAAANSWDVRNQYADVPGSLNGRRHLVRASGPEHQMRLDDNTWVTARTVADYAYDTDSPIDGDNTKEPFDLVTKQVESALVNGQLRDSRETRTSYGSTEDQWKLRIPHVVTTVDPSGQNIVRKSTFDEDGNETARYQPRSQSDNQASTTKFIHYVAGSDSTVPAQCRNHPEWRGLVCEKSQGADTTTGSLPALPKQTIQYNYLRQPTMTTEIAGTKTLRTSSKTYDEAGRATDEQVTSSYGVSVKATRHVYSEYTGQEVRTESLNAGGSVDKQVKREYDSVGRLVKYTDADGHESTTTYDILSRPVLQNDGKATRINGYDLVTGDLTTVTDSAAGVFTGAYDADGRLTQTTLPGGIVKNMQYDESGSLTYLTWDRCSNGSNCRIYDQFAVENAHGQYNALMDNTDGADSTTQYYDYDAAGRLTRTQNYRDNGSNYWCTIRDYTYDVDSNRTKFRMRGETAGGCDWNGSGTLKTNSFDEADRITNSGYTYDALGRITKAPAADTGQSGILNATYYTNDLVRMITQNGSTQTFELDPNLRVSRKIKTGPGGGAETYAYTDDSDSPAWIQAPNGWSRVVDGITGAEAMQDSSGDLKLQITNIRGDVVAQSSTVGTLSNVSRVDEFGVPEGQLPAGTRYAFHGSKQREALTAGGVVMMGVRLYQPQQGRFLQVDPVLGGTANSYEYPSDPVNGMDLDGRACFSVRASSRFYGVGATVFGNWCSKRGKVDPGNASVTASCKLDRAGDRTGVSKCKGVTRVRSGIKGKGKRLEYQATVTVGNLCAGALGCALNHHIYVKAKFFADGRYSVHFIHDQFAPGDPRRNVYKKGRAKCYRKC